MFGTLCFLLCGTGELQSWAADNSEIAQDSFDSDIFPDEQRTPTGVPVVNSSTLHRECSTISDKSAILKPVEIKLLNKTQNQML